MCARPPVVAAGARTSDVAVSSSASRHVPRGLNFDAFDDGPSPWNGLRPSIRGEVAGMRRVLENFRRPEALVRYVICTFVFYGEWCLINNLNVNNFTTPEKYLAGWGNLWEITKLCHLSLNAVQLFH